MSRRNCLVCDSPLSWSGRGRPPTYCSIAHRRQAEEIRAVLPAMRAMLVWWRDQAAQFPRDRVHRFTENAAELAEEIVRAERVTGEGSARTPLRAPLIPPVIRDVRGTGARVSEKRPANPSRPPPVASERIEPNDATSRFQHRRRAITGTNPRTR